MGWLTSYWRVFLGTCFVLFTVPGLAPYQEGRTTEKLPAGQSKPSAARTRQQVSQHVEQLMKAGKFDEALPDSLLLLESDQSAFFESLKRVAQLHEDRGDYQAARAARRQVNEVCAVVFGPEDWRTIETAVAHAHADAVARLGSMERTRFLRAANQCKRLQSALAVVGETKLPGGSPASRKMRDLALGLLGVDPKDLVRSAEEARETLRALLGAEDRDYLHHINNIAFLYESLGQPEKAEPLYEEAVATTGRVYKERHPYVADNLHNLAMHYQEYGFRFVKAEPLYLRAIAIREQTLGPTSLEVSHSIHNLAQVYENIGAYRSADTFYKRLIKIQRRRSGTPVVTLADNLGHLARVLKKSSRHAEAIPLVNEVLEIYRQPPNTNRRKYATNLNNLAMLYQGIGEPKKAEQTYKEAITLVAASHGETSQEYATTLSNLAEFYRTRARYKEARPLLQQAYGITDPKKKQDARTHVLILNNLSLLEQDEGNFSRAETLLDEALPLVGENLQVDVFVDMYVSVLVNLAGVYQKTGREERAKKLIENAIEATRKVRGDENPDFVSLLLLKAQLRTAIGDYGVAEQALRDALSLLRRVKGAKHPDCAPVMSNLGAFLLETGDVDGAETILRDALALLEPTRGRIHPSFASALQNLASVMRDRGQDTEAIAMLREVVTIRLTLAGDQHPDYAAALNNLALHLLAKQQFDEAEQALLKVRDIRKRAVGENHADYAQALNNLGAVFEMKGDYERARDLYLAAVQIFERGGVSTSHFDYANDLGNLAAQYDNLGNLAEAERYALKALIARERSLSELYGFQSDRQRLQQRRLFSNALSSYLSVAVKRRTAGQPFSEGATEIYDRVLAWKGSISSRRADEVRLNDQPELKPLLESLLQARAALSQRFLSIPQSSGADEWVLSVNELRDEKEQLESQIARKSAEFARAIASRQATAQQLQAAIPQGKALIDYCAYVKYSTPKDKRGKRVGESLVLAFVVNSSGVTCVALKPTSVIAPSVAEWRNAIEYKEEGDAMTSAARLSQLVWTPLRSALGDAKRIYVAPDGPLWLVPYPALPGSKAGEYLIQDGYKFSLITSGRHLFASLTKGKEAAPADSNDDLLALGGISYGGAEAAAEPPLAIKRNAKRSADPLRSGFDPLPATLDEAQRTIAAHAGAFPNANRLLLSKTDASESRVREELKHQWRFIHIGSHGFFLSLRELWKLRSAEPAPLALRDDRARGNLIRLMSNMNPLSFSGIALAGASALARDPRGATPSGDGLLTAEEVAGEDFTRTRLVVLSICDSGLGRLEAGEGVLGLPRAFESAGAKSVVCSLWKARTGVTQDLMANFYKNLWVGNRSTVDALHNAQLAILSSDGIGDRHHPFYWASWVLLGDAAQSESTGRAGGMRKAP